MKIIAKIYNDFTDKFGIPRQSGLSDIVSTIIFEPEYQNPDAVRSLESFSHLWLIWKFTETERENWSPTVRPPRLGGNKRVGVFATRSPFRPNPIGLSSVKLKNIEFTDNGPILYVTGADLLNGTPIYDIKPYIPFTDCHTDAIGGFTEQSKDYKLEVNISEGIRENFPKKKLNTLISILSGDPRPAYHNDEERIYGMNFAGYNIKFIVNNNTLKVINIEKIPV